MVVRKASHGSTAPRSVSAVCLSEVHLTQTVQMSKTIAAMSKTRISTPSAHLLSSVWCVANSPVTGTPIVSHFTSKGHVVRSSSWPWPPTDIQLLRRVPSRLSFHTSDMRRRSTNDSARFKGFAFRSALGPSTWCVPTTIMVVRSSTCCFSAGEEPALIATSTATICAMCWPRPPAPYRQSTGWGYCIMTPCRETCCGIQRVGV